MKAFMRNIVDIFFKPVTVKIGNADYIIDEYGRIKRDLINTSDLAPSEELCQHIKNKTDWPSG